MHAWYLVWLDQWVYPKRLPQFRRCSSVAQICKQCQWHRLDNRDIPYQIPWIHAWQERQDREKWSNMNFKSKDSTRYNRTGALGALKYILIPYLWDEIQNGKITHKHLSCVSDCKPSSESMAFPSRNRAFNPCKWNFKTVPCQRYVPWYSKAY